MRGKNYQKKRTIFKKWFEKTMPIKKQIDPKKLSEKTLN